MRKTIKQISTAIIILYVLCIGCKDNVTNTSLNFEIHLCYQKQCNNSHWQIYIDNINGTIQKNISNNPNNDAYGPVWSPNGKYIAFRYDRENGTGSDIYLYNIFNAVKINITPEFTLSESASPKLWSPDSKKLIYYYHKIGEPPCYYIMNADGTEKKKLFESESVSLISFCDDGSSILFSKKQFLYKVNLLNMSTEMILDFKKMSNNSIYVDGYNPNSNTILCHEDSSSWDGGATFSIKKVNLNTKEVETLVVSENGIKLFHPVLSNDGSKIAYIERDNDNIISRIILIKEGNKIKLNELKNKNESYGAYIEFSPHSNYLIYTVRKIFSNERVSITYDVYVLNIVTREAHIVTEAVDPHWNPLINY